ncbi:PAS domain-containing sensor histidine kinase [Haloarcula salinisoli]|uniref:histidine kinase n=1 Tax=Haloarcula salinisoli TaxID=2487746 RepID=A0A8J7YCU9_9EURY|nr:ATP-binding protein [Halomicroarcula salinisoli]MBX0303052.1 PAS domain-containing protein [Halomicroarcula salinisoli]
MPADMDDSIYANIFDATPEPVMVHHPETGRILDANQAACELVGRDCEQLVGATVGEISTAGFTTEEAVAAIRRAADDGDHHVAWEVVGPEGQQRSVEVTLERLDVDGTVRVVAFVREPTEGRERDRDRIQWSEQVRTMVNNLPVVVFALDADGTFTHSAGKGLSALGLEQGELTGASIFDVYADYPEIIDAAEEALAGDEVRVTQSVEDLVFETWYQPVFEAGEVAQVVGVARNITELKRREERVDALSEATNDLLYTHTEAAVAERVTEIAERVIDRPIAAMWAYDGDDTVLYPVGATETAIEFAGVDIPKDLPDMEPGSDEMAIFDAGEPAVIEDYTELDAPSAPGVPLGTLLCLPLDDHGLLCVGSTTVEPFDESERHLLDILSSTATAALDRVARETELNDQRAELAASNEALQRRRDQMEFFNSILRHDILNGMNVIRARGDMLASELDGDHGAYAETIVEWSDDIVDLTRKVRSVLQTLSDEASAETKPVELAPVVESAARRAASMTPGATVDVSVHSDVAVTADDLLHDVFGNILTNAVEHGSTDSHGQDEEPGVAVEVTTSVDEETVTVRIADDGPGIAPDVRDRIFERGGKSTDSGGTGFGLYFVDAMIASYGGQIRVEESDKGGAVFVVELPKA